VKEQDRMAPDGQSQAGQVQEELTLEGHIIDSLMLTNVLDDIVAFGGDFRILEVHVGQGRTDRSHARVEVQAPNPAKLNEIINQVSKHGALVTHETDVSLNEADLDGVFPQDFYPATNQVTRVRFGGQWRLVQHQEMDCGIRYHAQDESFRCVPMNAVRRGDKIVCGHRGIKVAPQERGRERGVFEFMGTEVSIDKPKRAQIRACARMMVRCKQEGHRILLVAGPALVHTGSTSAVVTLIERGYINVLFAGNGLAVHDIEHAIFGTSMGIHIERATLADTGHEHPMRVTNLIRRLGGIPQAVDRDELKSGIMHACVKHGVRYVLAGSIRDAGPLPEVIVNAEQAQQRMREEILGPPPLGMALIVGSAYHGMATSNLLPAWIPAVCVDIAPMVLQKLVDRGAFQTIGLLTDAAAFFGQLADEIVALDTGEQAVSLDE
jgi:lysine-ketoglutarate reductase/saccharopine dehydrogenase-like protein (TIGR00300 family)